MSAIYQAICQSGGCGKRRRTQDPAANTENIFVFASVTVFVLCLYVYLHPKKGTYCLLFTRPFVRVGCVEKEGKHMLLPQIQKLSVEDQEMYPRKP